MTDGLTIAKIRAAEAIAGAIEANCARITALDPETQFGTHKDLTDRIGDLAYALAEVTGRKDHITLNHPQIWPAHGKSELLARLAWHEATGAPWPDDLEED